MCLLWRCAAVVAVDVEVQNTRGETFDPAQQADLHQADAPGNIGLPLRLGKVLNFGVCCKMRVVTGIEVEVSQPGSVAAEFQIQVQLGVLKGLFGDLCLQIGEVDVDTVPVGFGQVLHAGVQVLGRDVERNGAVVDEDQAVGKLDLFGLQVQKRVLDGLGAGRSLLRNGLVGLAVLVDDQVRMWLLHPQEVQAYMRLRALADRVAQEAVDFQADEDLRRGEVRRFPRRLGAVDDEVIYLDGKVPQVEANMADIDLAAGRVLEDRLDLAAHAVLEVLGARVPVQAEEHDQYQNGKRDKDPAKETRHAVVGPPQTGRRCGLPRVRRRRNGALWRSEVAHGASSPGCRIVMLPCARRLCSQSRSRLDTCCCCNTSRMRGSTEAKGAGLVPAFLYSGSMVFW